MRLSVMMKTDKELKNGGRAIKKAFEKYRSGSWKVEKLMKAINKHGKECITLVQFSPADVKELTNLAAVLTERAYEKGDNSDRKRFTHSCYHTVLGKFFQEDIKNIIRKALETAEWWIEHKYDRDAFVYDSEWLKRLDKFIDNFIEERFQHAQYKLVIAHRCRHIILFMAKEDRYYGPILKDFINRFVVEFADGVKLTESEQYGLDVFNTGTTAEIAARIETEKEAGTWMKA